MAEVVEINDIDALGSYRMTWNSLLGDTPRASFFHTLDWLEVYWRHFGDGHKLRALVVVAAGRPIGIVPLCVRHEGRHFGTVRVLTYPLDGWGSWYSPVGGAQAATLAMAMRHVASSEQDWDMIDLPWIDAEGSDRGRTQRAMIAAGFRPIQRAEDSASVVELNADWDSYLNERCSKTRHEIRRVLRRVSECGEVEYVRCRPEPLRDGDGDPHWGVYDQCEEVARHSWQAGSTDGNTLSHERYRPMLREAHAAAARLGMVDLNLLKVDGKPVAFNYNYHYNGAVFGLRMGYREDFPQKGVGMALLMKTIQDSFQRGDNRLELGVGDYAYKRRVRTRFEDNYRVTHTPLTSWRSQAVRLSRWMKSGKPAIGK